MPDKRRRRFYPYTRSGTINSNLYRDIHAVTLHVVTETCDNMLEFYRRASPARLRFLVTRLLAVSGTFNEDIFAFMTISCCIHLTMRNVLDKSCRENQNTRFMFSDFFPKIVPFVR